MKLELDQKELETALCIWAMGWQRGQTNAKFNHVTFYTATDGDVTATVAWIEPLTVEQGR